MNIHEHQAKQILKKYGVPVPEGIFALTVDELIEKAKLLKTENKLRWNSINLKIVIGSNDEYINDESKKRFVESVKSYGLTYDLIEYDGNHKIIEKELEKIKAIKLRNLNILANKSELNNYIKIKVRSTGRLLKAKVNLLEKFAHVEILDKETGISPGQACVFYSKDKIGDKVLGGGWIHKTLNNNLSTKLTT